MLGRSKFKLTVVTILVAMSSSQMARAGDDSRIYTKSEQLASGRMAFSACFHVASIAKDRCERVGSARGYSEDELHRSAERLLQDAQASRDSGGVLSVLTIVATPVVGALGFGGYNLFKYRIKDVLAPSAGLGAMAGVALGLAGAGAIRWYFTSKASELDQRLGALENGKPTTGFDIDAYKRNLLGTLNLAQVDSPRAAPSLSDSLLKDLEEGPADAQSTSAGSAATPAQ